MLKNNFYLYNNEYYALYDCKVYMDYCRNCYIQNIVYTYKKNEKIKDLGGLCNVCYNDIIGIYKIEPISN